MIGSADRQYKHFSTRRLRADLHQRLRMLAASQGTSMEGVINWVLQAGLEVCEGLVREAGEGREDNGI